MRDWKRFVREQLAEPSMPRATREEIIAELAAHLEDFCEDERSQGQSEAEAMKRALAGIRWRELARGIRAAKRKEEEMNQRTKSLWLPAMVSLLGASLSLMLLQRLGFQPRLVWTGNVAVLFYWPWLAGLPVFGALGAYLSQRAQGPVRARLAAAAAPALVILLTFLFILPWGLAIDGFSAIRLVYFGIGVANWVVIPGTALLAGAVPFLRGAQPREGVSQSGASVNV